MDLSEKGLNTLKSLEGFRGTIYLDAAGKPTIGYGHLVVDGEEFDTITEAEGEAILRNDLSGPIQSVNDCVKVPITQGQFDALVLFVFNVGLYAFATSTLLMDLNAGKYSQVPIQLMRWVNAGGQRVQGLVNRRKAEVELWQSD